MEPTTTRRRLGTVAVGALIAVVLLSRCTASILTPLWLDALDGNSSSDDCSKATYATVNHIDAYTTLFIVNFLFFALFGITLVFSYSSGVITEREKRYPKKEFALIGVSDTLAAVCLVYASSGCRTAPYLQALGTNFSVPVTFIVRFCILRRRPTCRKTMCAVLVLLAEFTALIPSIFPGLESQQERKDLGGASGVAGVLWPLCFFMGYIPLAIVSTVIERAVQTGGRQTSPEHSTDLNIPYVLFWCYSFSLLSLLTLFWTDFIPGFGMTAGPSNFFRVFWFNIKCYFGYEGCVGVINVVSLICTASLVIMRVANTYFLRFTEGANYLVMVTSMQTPLVFLFFTLFDENPFHWHPHASLATWLSIAALVVMVPAVYIYDTGPPEWQPRQPSVQSSPLEADQTTPLLDDASWSTNSYTSSFEQT